MGTSIRHEITGQRQRICYSPHSKQYRLPITVVCNNFLGSSVDDTVALDGLLYRYCVALQDRNDELPTALTAGGK